MKTYDFLITMYKLSQKYYNVCVCAYYQKGVTQYTLQKKHFKRHRYLMANL